MSKNTKKCIIRNTSVTWILEVDGLKIPFRGAQNADYFHDLYKILKYDVEIIQED